MNKKVLLGMSSGVDSSVAALLLQKQGFEVVGITFLFGDLEESNHQIVAGAKDFAKQIGIKHLVVDYRQEFKNTVIKYFVEEYQQARTPFPCAWCNPKIKFSLLEKYAELEKCDNIATGHYAVIKKYSSGSFIYKGIDPDKDQSFFLWGLKSSLIERLIFPLGEYEKEVIRKIAEKNGFKKLAVKKDSLGICFIEGNDYREFLNEQGIISSPGNFVDVHGAILGRHDGIVNYTIGQRRGLGINRNIPLFVSEIRLEANEIVLSEYDHMFKKELLMNECYFNDNELINSDYEYTVKVRYRLQLTRCKINIQKGDRAVVELLNPEAMIAKGQTAVFYDGDRLIGGGFIEDSF